MIIVFIFTYLLVENTNFLNHVYNDQRSNRAVLFSMWQVLQGSLYKNGKNQKGKDT